MGNLNQLPVGTPEQLARMRAIAMLYPAQQKGQASDTTQQPAPQAAQPANSDAGGASFYAPGKLSGALNQPAAQAGPNAQPAPETSGSPAAQPFSGLRSSAAPRSPAAFGSPGTFSSALSPLPTLSTSNEPSFADRYRTWEESEPKAPNPSDYKTSVHRKLFGALAAGGLGALTSFGGGDAGEQAAVNVGERIANPTLYRAEANYNRAHNAWEQLGPRLEKEGQMAELDDRVRASQAAARRDQDNRTLDQMYTDAVRNGDADSQQRILQAITDIKGADREATPFSLWRQQNPNAPIASYFTAEKGPKNFTDPFEAYLYGTPEQQQSAKDFLHFENTQKLSDRAPSEIEQRYQLFKKDPAAYKDMFGDRDAAQNSRDQAQAARMLKYFQEQRAAISKDFTLDDAAKQSKLAEIDDLEKPYLDIAQPQNAQGAASGAGAGGNGNANGQGARPQTGANASGRGSEPQYKVGDDVTYKGAHYRVSGIRRDGSLELDEVKAGTQ